MSTAPPFQVGGGGWAVIYVCCPPPISVGGGGTVVYVSGTPISGVGDRKIWEWAPISGGGTVFSIYFTNLFTGVWVKLS